MSPNDQEDVLRGRMLVVDGPAGDIDGFKRCAQKAAALGATHMVVSNLPPSRWQRYDPKDPYPSWSMQVASIFKVVTPPELSEWLPVEETRRSLETIRERCEVLRECGLKGFFSGGEAMWLPEGVFEAHPDWRGPECQLLVISRHPHWCPCIDNPEVLDLYRRATAELCRQAPEIDTFSFMTNDSGNGVCWSTFIYPGINGPLACRERTMGQRLEGFLSAIQEGAAQAGVKADAQIGGAFTGPEMQSVWPHLKEGQAVNGRYGDGTPFGSGAGWGWFSNHTFPVVGVAQPFRFARGLEGALAGSGPRVSVTITEDVAATHWPVFEQCLQGPTHGPLSRAELVGRVAAGMVGQENAEGLLEVWELIDRAIECIRHVRNRGFASPLLVGATQKWLIRPLVPQPMALTPDEKDYWRRHQFAAKSEEEAADLQNLLGRPGIVGQAAVWMAKWATEDALGLLRRAAGMLDGLKEKAPDAEQERELELLAYRLRALCCAVRNAQNTIIYQDILDRCDKPQPLVNTADWHRNLVWDGRSMELRKIARAEIDNTNELISLLQQAPGPLLAAAGSAEEEDVFHFGPDVVEHLRKKVAIMVAHWDEYEQLYPSEPPRRARVWTDAESEAAQNEGPPTK